LPGRLRVASDRWAEGLVDALIGLLRRRPADDAVGALCAAMCAELRAGASAESALLIATRDNPITPRGRTAAELGEPVAPAIRADAAAAQSAALAGIAACWQAAAESGAGLADGLQRVAALARAERRVAADLASETAAPRATARILALLPLLGLLFGELMGAHPVRWLLASRWGWLCLILGAIFLSVGQAWTIRIHRQALPRSGVGLR